LWELRNDGTMLLDAFGNPIPTYDQADVTELARVYTGFAYPPLGTASPSISAPVNYSAPMVPIENQHDTGSKRILDIGVIAAGRTATSDVYTANGAIFSHPNVGPYIGKQLIQHL